MYISFRNLCEQLFERKYEIAASLENAPRNDTNLVIIHYPIKFASPDNS